VAALEVSQKRHKTDEGRVLDHLRKNKDYIAALKKAGGDVDAVCEMMKPRETQVLPPQDRKLRNGELYASHWLQVNPNFLYWYKSTNSDVNAPARY